MRKCSVVFVALAAVLAYSLSTHAEAADDRYRSKPLSTGRWEVANLLATNSPCSDILQNGIFENYRTKDVHSLVEQAQHYYCDVSSGSTQSSTGIGLDVSAVVDELPVHFLGQYRDDDREGWSRQICRYDWNQLQDWSLKEVEVRKASETLANAWLRCLELQQDTIVGALSFTSDEDFVLTVQINGLGGVDRLRYHKSGIRFSPNTAAELLDFNVVSKTVSRKHQFRGKRKALVPFEVLIDSIPVQIKIRTPASDIPRQELPPFQKIALADMKPKMTEGLYYPRNCYGTSSILIADGKSYPDSVVFPPDLNGRSAVEWRVPFGAKKLVLAGAGFCHEPYKRDCFDSSNGFAAAYVRVLVDGQQLFVADLTGRHDLPPSYSTNGGKGFEFQVEGKRTVRFETDVPITRWCAHSTILNPYFE